MLTVGKDLYPSNEDAGPKYWNDNARNIFTGIALYPFETPPLPYTYGAVL
nr:hypothetical protein [Paraburkholderia hospita]